MSISAFGDGLDVNNIDVTTPAEIAQFREFYTKVKGAPLPAHEILLEFRPDMLKRHRALARQLTDRENEQFPLAHTLANLHYYMALGFGEGIRYEIIQARAGGAKFTDVLDTVAISQIHACTLGMAALAHEGTEVLRDWSTDDSFSENRFPPHWTFDRDVLRSGLDFTNPQMAAEEVGLVEHWYEMHLLEVPAHVTYLAKYRPDVLKAHRSRYECAIRDSLPVQAMPYLMLHLAISRRSATGIRENVLLAKALGLKRSEVLDVISWGLFYGGPDAMSLVSDTLGDLLDSYE